MTTFKDAIRQVFPEADFIDERTLPADTLAKGQQICDAYTDVVGSLRKNINPRLAALGRGLWDLVHHRHVHMVLYEGVVVVTFAVVAGDKGKQQAFILIPPQWLDVVVRAPLMGVGTVIYTGSQALDWYNDRLSEGSALTHRRAASYEAEFLKGFRGQKVLPLNEYQLEVLRDHPDGLDVKCAYDYRPVAPEPS